MGNKIGIAVVHGIGKQTPDFSNQVRDALNERCYDTCGDDLVFRPVYWAPVLQEDEDELWERILEGGVIDVRKLRRFLIDFMADALAYQPTKHDRRAYDGIHAIFARTMRELAEEVGGNAPLCIIAHSLGTIITSNYIYDLQIDQYLHVIPFSARQEMGNTPLERGETLTLLYTLGSPIALWSMRYSDFGRPILFPPPSHHLHYPNLKTEWINIFDRDDIFGYPLKSLNEKYDDAVTEDREKNIGTMVERWNPLSHMGYWTDNDVVEPISESLIRTWRAINPDA